MQQPAAGEVEGVDFDFGILTDVNSRQAARCDDKLLGAESSTSEPKGQDLVYAARLSLDRTRMQVEDNLSTSPPGWP